MYRIASLLVIYVCVPVLLQAQAYWKPQVNIHPLQVNSYINSTRPSGFNDAELWQGVGLTQRVSAGFQASSGPFIFQLQPSFVYTQNREFDPSGLITPRIDLPERFGSDPLFAFFPGESFAAIRLAGWEAGAGTRTYWWGPGHRNSLILGRQAPGFNHVFLGTTRPVSVYIGTLELQYLLGRLEASGYDNQVFPPDWRLFTGLHVAYQPRFISGLTLGLNRSFINNGGNLSTWQDYFPILQPFQKDRLGFGTIGDGSQPDDQRASVFFSWEFEPAGFRFYGEYGREDHSENIRDILNEPNHFRAYVLGFDKTFRTHQKAYWFLITEITHMQASNTEWVRGGSYWYSHTRVLRGYTHQGQILGAGLGPGGESWYLELNRIGASSQWKGYLERIEWNTDLARRTFEGTPAWNYETWRWEFSGSYPKMTELLLGAAHERTFGRITAALNLEYGYLMNKRYEPGRNEGNLAVRVTMVVQLGK